MASMGGTGSNGDTPMGNNSLSLLQVIVGMVCSRLLYTSPAQPHNCPPAVALWPMLVCFGTT